MASTSAGTHEMDIDLPACPVCQEEYDEKVAPMVIECGHTICGGCIINMKNHASQQGATTMSCPTCRKPCNREEVPKNFKLAEAISVIKKLRDKPDAPENPVECTQCSKVDDESDMFVCRNCVNEAFKYDVIGSINPQADVNVKTVAICGSCAIRSHVSQGHETVAYFPFSSGLHFESQLTSVSLLREELEQQVNNTNDWYMHFGTTVQKFNTELNKMTDMMRKSKSSSVQQEFSNRIGEQIGRMSEHVQSICGAISKSEIEFKKKFDQLVALNIRDEATKCSELPERKSETICSECSVRQTEDRLLCCKSCSDVVKGLMEDLLDASKLDAVDIDSLPICSNCLIVSHLGANHEAVQFSLAQSKYRSFKRLVQVENQKLELSGKFSGLLETFKHYITLLADYDDKISRMSKIAVESRGQPNHDHYVEGFQMCLEEAETAIKALQSNTEKSKTLVKEKQETLDAVEDQFATSEA